MNKDLSPGASVARGATYVFLQGLISAALGVIYIVILTRLLSPADIGTFGMLTFALGLIQTIGLLALPSASIKYIAHFLAEDNLERARAIVVRVLQISAVIAVVAFVVVFAFSAWISAVLSCPLLIVQTLAIASVFAVFFYQAIAFLQGFQMLREVAAINLLFTVAQYGLAILLIYAGYGLFGVIASWSIALAIGGLSALVLTANNVALRGKPHEIKPLLRFSAPLYISGILGFFVVWIDQLFVLPYKGLETFGAYNIANRASVVPALVAGALVAALFPKLSQLYAESGKESLEEAFKKTTRYVVLIGFPMTLLVAILAYPIIILFAGPLYAQAAFPLALLCVASLFNTLGVAIGPTFYTIERTGLSSIIAFVTVVVDALLSYVLIAFFGTGMTGAAMSKIFAAAVGFFIGIVVLAQYIKVNFDIEMLWKVSVACAFMTLVILGFDVLRQLLSGPPYHFLVFRLLLLPAYVIVGAVAFFSAMIFLGAAKKEDIELFREYLPRRLKWAANVLERLIEGVSVLKGKALGKKWHPQTA